MDHDDSQTCVACQASAPSTNSEYTLMGEKHAWRCKKAVHEDGSLGLAWYCPTCWKTQAEGGAPALNAANAPQEEKPAGGLGSTLRKMQESFQRWRGAPPETQDSPPHAARTKRSRSQRK